mmetsp:Transcript_15728/g.28255  ORF Transcript_15728/g.28255 Transcript_15728/m.28255 type:complete len:229 (+) Transcript_15728:141-827(+)|eukprot:CAMPEP_0197525414 /NCGR_PEP_ID=MMETSP1318-20131121/11904_1 /TAXON_ID=552666 /ORGANISM="Partenskyella glossopodia, Strain RCC365" /LENGTH=228 /DNA_ID=CAMNT_0043078795 /DNA_START=100 /DNA_END=789 /DNA_ORIENTATION=+
MSMHLLRLVVGAACCLQMHLAIQTSSSTSTSRRVEHNQKHSSQGTSSRWIEGYKLNLDPTSLPPEAPVGVASGVVSPPPALGYSYFEGMMGPPPQSHPNIMGNWPSSQNLAMSVACLRNPNSLDCISDSYPIQRGGILSGAIRTPYTGPYGFTGKTFAPEPEPEDDPSSDKAKDTPGLGPYYQAYNLANWDWVNKLHNATINHGIPLEKGKELSTNANANGTLRIVSS